ncbi:MAG TPA: cation:proton antiporter [Bellilinea sp.]|nr:cation:proton antiporter [Bellilinea sp.]
MSNFLQFVFLLTLILVAAKASGYLATRLGQPSVLGELLVGLLLGPSLVDIVHLPFITNQHIGETINELGELGVLLLMFLAGLELHLSDLAKNTKVAAYAGLLGVVVPVGLGVAVGELFGMTLENSIFLGLTMGATSVSISAQTLMEMKVLRSRVGLGLLGAAVFDDILVILLLSSFVALADGGSAIQIVLVIVKMMGFLALSAAFGLYALPRLTVAVSKMHISQNVLTFALVIMLIYGLTAELLGGMAAITGTFVAGLMFGRTTEKAQLESGLRALSYAFFVPIFFVNIGLAINLREVSVSALWLLLALSILAILGKIIGSGLGARLGKFSWLESLQLGIGMVSRGEVGLIVAAIGLNSGQLKDDGFSAVIGMILITTLVTPLLLRAAFKPPAQKRVEPLPSE